MQCAYSLSLLPLEYKQKNWFKAVTHREFTLFGCLSGLKPNENVNGKSPIVLLL